MSEQTGGKEYKFYGPVGSVGNEGTQTNVAGVVQGDQVYNAASETTLAEAAAEIQQLLAQLAETYPMETTHGQMSAATEAIARIEGDPSLKQRVMSAARTGGVAALRKAIDHPAGAFVAGEIEGWLAK